MTDSTSNYGYILICLILIIFNGYQDGKSNKTTYENDMKVLETIDVVFEGSMKLDRSLFDAIKRTDSLTNVRIDKLEER